MSKIAPALLVAFVACAACSKREPPEPAPTPTAAASPWSATSTHVEVTRFGVNAPRPDGRACWTARYSLDARDRSLHVETCVDDDPMARDLTLGDADFRKVQAALASLRAGAATACDAKGATYLVQVSDRSRAVAHFTDAANGCHAGDMATLDRATTEALFAALAAAESHARS